MGDFLATVGKATLRDASGNLRLTADVLKESGANHTNSEQEVRGGKFDALIGRFFTGGKLALTLSNSTYNMEFIALNMGSDITIGGDVPKEESITVGAGGTITVSETPQDIDGLGTIGWYRLPESSQFVPTFITFVGKTATVVGLTQGINVCVKYSTSDATVKTFVIPSNAMPKTLSLELTIPKFSSEADITGGSESGFVLYKVPKFQLDGTVDLSITSEGSVAMPLSGTALSINSNANNCSLISQFGTVSEVTYNKAWYEDLTDIGVLGGNIDMTVGGGTETISIQGVYGTYTGMIANSKLTFTSGTPATCTVGASTGIITPVASGTSLITITVTEKPEITELVLVTVTA